MKELIKQAKQGDAEAQFLLGMTFYNGNVLEKNPEKAFRWWMKAAKQEYVFAMPYLIYCYEQGYGTKVDKKKAFYILRKLWNMVMRMYRRIWHGHIMIVSLLKKRKQIRIRF